MNLMKQILPKLGALQITRNVLSTQTFTQRYNSSSAPVPYEIVNDNEKDNKYNELKSDVINHINELNKVKQPLFAVVHVAGKQFKITSGDLIIIEGYWPPDAGDKINLDKVMLVGSKEFSLIGRPVIQKDLVKVETTVIEKTLSHTKTYFRKKRRKQYKQINFYRIPQTVLQINNIYFNGELNNLPEVSDVTSRSIE